MIRIAHGQREPKETAAWEAATLHLFDLAFAAVEAGADPDALTDAIELGVLARRLLNSTTESALGATLPSRPQVMDVT